MTMISYLMFPYGHNWDEPKVLDEDVPKDLASYVLGGAFLECCNQHKVLNDETMCYINKDVYNRFYTLVIKEFL